MLDVKNIRLSQEELDRCIEFSKKSAPNQQAIEFGQRTTKPRGTNEIARDNLIGKIAEVAFSKMMKENYSISVPLDFNYYPLGQWDSQDAVINSWRIDVKGTRQGGHWMLIEWNKLKFRQRDNNLSHLYVMFSVAWNRTADCPTGLVSYEGAASLKRLNSECATTKVLRKGDVIPGTHAILQADNYGIEFSDLYTDLDGLVQYLTTKKPPKSLTAKFPSPYTGQTTEQILSTAKLDETKSRKADAETKAEPGILSKMAFWTRKLLGNK